MRKELSRVLGTWCELAARSVAGAPHAPHGAHPLGRPWAGAGPGGSWPSCAPGAPTVACAENGQMTKLSGVRRHQRPVARGGQCALT